jgi:manganese efflux pump family protein
VAQALTVAALAFGLAMDAFAVSIAVGAALGRPTPRQFFRLAFHFGWFQFMMPVLGWLAADAALSALLAVDHWIAFLLLGFLGARMIREGLKGDGDAIEGDPTKGASLIMLSTATSIDALAVGLSLRFMEIGVLGPCIVIGLCAAGMTVLGMVLGRAGRGKLGGRAQVAGGAVLVLIGAHILVEHLTV